VFTERKTDRQTDRHIDRHIRCSNIVGENQNAKQSNANNMY